MNDSTNLQAHWDRLAYDRRDLTNCESEPLQFCGAIQSYGQLLVWELRTGRVVAVSENADEVFPGPVADLLNRPVSELLPGADGLTEDAARHPQEILLPGAGSKVLSYHFLGPYGYAEMEPAGRGVNLENSMTELRRMIFNMESLEQEDEVCQLAADQLRELTDYERVMVYRFEQNWDGQVIAESVAESLEPYRGLYYPASDIPPQARQLYLESRCRIISDVQKLPVRVLTAVGLGRSELDLSKCNLRACSPIHIQYLANMGVRASFSVPIRLDGKLWGLISCHHNSEPQMPYHYLRVAGEMAAQVVSARITGLKNQRRLRIKNTILELSQKLLSEVTKGRTAVSAFTSLSEQVLNLTNSQGVFIRLAGQESRLGQCPSADLIDQLWNHLRAQGAMTLWCSDCLSSLGMPTDPDAAGAMAVPLSLGFEDLILWFRPEHVREVRWGGKPGEGKDILQPRESFAAWKEIVAGRSRMWTEADEEAAQYLLFNFVQGIFENAADLALANQELERLTRAKDEFIGMISHELRTPLGVILGWIEIMRDLQRDFPPLEEPLDVIERNAKTQVSLINDLLDISRIVSGKMRINPQAGVDLCALIQDVVSSLQPTAQARNISLVCECESLVLSGDPERLRQIIWNLVSNALKFTPKEGRVEVRAEQVDSGCRLQVIDNGIGFEPRLSETLFTRFIQLDESGHRSGGLGLGLSIVRSLVELHGGTVEASSPGPQKGSTFTVTLPIYSLRPARPDPAGQRPADVSLFLKGWRILVAEDQPDAASALAYLLRRQGAEVEVAGNGREAFEMLRSTHFDVLLSDIGMPEADGYTLIRRWRALEKERRQTPVIAIALTAYAASADRARAIEAGYQNHVAKPVDRHELLAILKALRPEPV